MVNTGRSRDGDIHLILEHFGTQGLLLLLVHYIFAYAGESSSS